GTASALAKIKARSMVFLSRVVYQAVFRRVRTARPGGAPKSSFCTVLRSSSVRGPAIFRHFLLRCRAAAVAPVFLRLAVVRVVLCEWGLGGRQTGLFCGRRLSGWQTR
ncbi:MAG: hypothetical protein ACN6OQ_20440, partial [Paraburkholderia nemoris]